MAGTGLIVGVDGSDAGERALEFAKARAREAEGAKLTIVFVIEWSPFTFQTPEENELRHQRREQELAIAHERVLDPAVASARGEGFDVEGIVRHGDASRLLDEIAVEKNAAQIIIGRVGHTGLVERIFGGVSGRLIASATVPVTIVP